MDGKNKKIGILGLGWIGEGIALRLMKAGYHVVGTTTCEEKKNRLRQQGIDTYLLEFNPSPAGESFDEVFDVDVLYINIPPSRRTKPDGFHPEQIQHIRDMAIEAKVPHIIYISATSVYPDLRQEAFESDPLTYETTGNLALWTAEQVLWEEKPYDLTVVRFGGLLGDNRVPGNYFSGKENVAGYPPANYIYRTDAERAILWIISQSLWNTTFNIVAPIHPSKADIYEHNAKLLGFAPPKSYVSDGPWKKINSEKFIETGFKFEYPDPMEFPYYLNAR
jgi:nucleoside-diphosphate-sugar epimerase